MYSVMCGSPTFRAASENANKTRNLSHKCRCFHSFSAFVMSCDTNSRQNLSAMLKLSGLPGPAVHSLPW